MDHEDVLTTRALKVTVELVLKRVSWIGVRLEPSNRLQVRVCLFGFHLQTRLLPTGFPAQIRERFIYERTFPLCTQPSHVFSNLEGDRFAVDLVEVSGDESTTLATFRSEVNELLFGDPPHVHVNESRTNYYDFTLENTSHFLKNLYPVLSATVKVAMTPVQDPLKETKSDGAFNLTLGSAGIAQHPAMTYENAPLRKSTISTHLTRQEVPRRLCQRVILKNTRKKEESPTRRPFVVRHVDEKLIGRTPGSGEEPVPTEQTTDVGYFHARKTLAEKNFSASQNDTVASRLRRRPHIYRSVTDLKRDTLPPRNDLWCREQLSGSNGGQTRTSDNLGKYVTASRKWNASGDAGINGSGKQRQTLLNDRKWSASSDTLRKPSEEQESRRLNTSESEFTATATINCACCSKHHNQTCTICRLYQQYFGEAYPNHSL